MKKILSMLVCASALLAVSCVKDEPYGTPSISGVKNTIAYTAEDVVTVTATVTSLDKIISVNLYYSASSASYTAVQMQDTGNNVYSGVIPAFPLDTEISYYVEASTAVATVKSSVMTYIVGEVPEDYSGLVLNELNGNDKFIELYNKGDKAIRLNGVYIEKDGNNVWEAAGITLEPNDYLLLYSEDVIATDHPEYEGSGLVFASGLSAKKAVRVQMFTPSGISIDDFNLVDYSTPAPASYSRYPDGTGPWTYADATPKGANAPSTELVKGLADPEIGDVGGGNDNNTGNDDGEDDGDGEDNGDDNNGGGIDLADYSGLVLNELNGNDKFIELYNKGNETILLDGVYIEKDGNNVWVAEGFSLEPNDYLLLYSEDVIATDHPEYEGSGLVFASGLSAKKEVRVQIFSPSGISIDDFNLVNCSTPAPASYSRYPDGTGPWTYADATPKSANASSTELVEGLADPEVGDVGGNKPDEGDDSGDSGNDPVVPADAKVVLNEVDGNTKYVELYNAGTASVSLTGYTLWKNDDMSEAIWTGAEGLTIGPDQYVVIYSDKAGVTVDDAYIFAGGLSPKKSVKIELKDADGKSADVFARGPEPWDTSVSENSDCSFSRVENGTGEWVYAYPTPGARNGDKVADITD